MTKLVGEKVRIRIWIGEGDRYGDKLLYVLAKRLRHPRNWTRIAVVSIILLAAVPPVGHSPAEARGNRFARGSGEKGFDGKAGPWLAEARLVSPKERGEQARSAGKTGEPAPPTYRLLFSLAEIRPKTPFPLARWRGTVEIERPDGETLRVGLKPLDGSMGAELALEKPGPYRFLVMIEEGGRNEAVSFSHTVR